ncbi:poly-gamma-glutamate hydrolase family protein [Desmonostoc muscorum LEGE 12446]|uniref:Poly-gamma-glutamate hydrolase family protein n=1 Tax=Desmonostoc muscorum LEGE 12446 TaxID=1828758 RepID=A0A8J6ZRE7_DESMC|nr:poly-gamma-glutamate hydrolase family protein [Desmonostoc muscorum]MCF2149123.1 poly-gamma-glutamate hydrolase family protein [Desmonostoc muscorum LEGE 12446]
MTTYNAEIQSTNTGTQEHCSADPDQLLTIGRAINQQIRVKFDDTKYAIYTVRNTPQETPDNIVRVTQEGGSRLGQSNFPFNVTIDSQVVNTTYNDDDAQESKEFVERLTDNGTHKKLIAIAPHGGLIEIKTDKQAERVASQLASKGVSCWLCKGWGDSTIGAYDRWHITSTDINEESFPLLKTIINRGFTHAVAFHGFTKNNILIGGRASDPLKQQIKTAIEKAIVGSGISVDIASAKSGYGGDTPQNIVNRLSNGNGIQIEQCSEARKQYWEKIADAVASVYESLI